MTAPRAGIDELRRQARALVNAVTDDESGSMVAGQWVGGHGGLLSRTTLAKADALRRTLDALDLVPA